MSNIVAIVTGASQASARPPPSGRRAISQHFAPTTTCELVAGTRVYTPKAILGTAYEFATGKRLASGDFEGGKSGA